MQSVFPRKMHILDTSAQVMDGDVTFPFAFEEVYGQKMGAGLLPPLCHLWRHERAFVVGVRDTRLPGFSNAVQWLQQQGYTVAVRNSGGAAVPLDRGVVNLSLLLPLPSGDLQVNRPFRKMAQLIQQTLPHAGDMVRIGAVDGAYCPGEFDVSISGRKFCGISQRRQIRAVLLHSFILAEGDGAERGQLVRSFYQRASGGQVQSGYPQVQPERMASLQQLIGVRDVFQYVEYVTGYITSIYSGEMLLSGYGIVDQQEVEKVIKQLHRRFIA